MITVSQRVILLIFLRPLSPSFWSFWKYGTAILNSWITIEAEMYGMIPSAKIDECENAPPENMSRRPKTPPDVC